MNPELLTLQRLTAGLLFQPTNLHPVQVNRIYAEITERYPFQSLQHLPDGARMANPEGDCFIQQTRVQVNEAVVHFQASKEKCVDLFSTIDGHIQVPQYMTFGVKLTAFLQMDEAPKAAQFIEKNMLPQLTEKLGTLGEGRQGVGIRIVLHRDADYDLKIEPFFTDLSQLYVELDVQHRNPFNGVAAIEGWMDSAYSFMFTEVKDLLAAFA
jgi:hypothetical protein